MFSGGSLGSPSGLGTERFRNCLLETSWAHFPGWGRKCFKIVFWGPPGLTSRVGAEMLQNSFLEASWAHFPGWGQKCFKTVLWKRPGLTFQVGSKNASKLFSGGLLDSLAWLGPEMLQNCSLEVFWAHFPGCVQQTLCSTNPCSTNPMLNKLHVQQTLCSTHPCSTKLMLNKLYVQQTLCPTNPMFNKPRVQET